MTAGASLERPGAGPYPSVALGDVVDRRLANGLRVLAVRRPHVPLAQLRLLIPLGDVGPRDAAILRVLPKVLLSGTGARTGSALAAEIQRLGASIDVSADADHLAVAASGPAPRLEEMLALVWEIVANPSFPAKEVAGERARVAQEVLQEGADPISVATHALFAELFPGHAYADPLPPIAGVRRTARAALERFYEGRVQTAGSMLVVVGDVDPERVVDVVGATSGAWATPTGTDGPGAMQIPRPPRPDGGILVVHRPGAVQSNLRVGTRCVDRHDPRFPALMLAVTTLGGSFTSRLVTNLRERNGYTYSPRAGIDEHRYASVLTVRAEVATEVTARAIAEVRYELSRMATATVSADELESSRRYVAGITAMAAATQAGLAGVLAGLIASDLDPSYLEHYLRTLADLDEATVSSVAGALGPAGMTTVVVGDADVIADALTPLDRVTVVGR